MMMSAVLIVKKQYFNSNIMRLLRINQSKRNNQFEKKRLLLIDQLFHFALLKKSLIALLKKYFHKKLSKLRRLAR